LLETADKNIFFSMVIIHSLACNPLQNVLREPWAVAVQDTIKRGAPETVRGGMDPFMANPFSFVQYNNYILY